ncbi:N-alpha-acetyltransferase 40 [Microplitis mediator]|uniref:N-alpha-acetyltransferase 40 n=1 Tax=Microplitis mediator TaxID=375433 RepID=UPI002557BA0E|nr:N-alpha-acetyltransferase 40 [Microplitis mediator]
MKSKKGHITRKQRLAKKEAEAKALVDKANSLVDPLSLLDSFKSYTTNSNIKFNLKCHKVKELSSELLSWIFDLMERNMKTLYEQSHWGWNKSSKHKELTEPTAWYLIAFLDDEPVGFSHFRYDLDDKVEVLYCYELQLESKVRRQGLGRFMMNTLEALSVQSAMKKVVLTVLKHNPDAKTFFQSLGYKVDTTSPSDWENLDYLILSK